MSDFSTQQNYQSGVGSDIQGSNVSKTEKFATEKQLQDLAKAVVDEIEKFKKAVVDEVSRLAGIVDEIVMKNPVDEKILEEIKQIKSKIGIRG